MVKVTTPGNMGTSQVEVELENDIDWDFTKFNPSLVKTAQNIREFDKWITWIKNSFDMTRPFNYLEIGSYAGESLYYLSQILPRGSNIVLVDLGENEVARDILKRIVPFMMTKYGHKITVLTGYSDNPELLKKARALPVGQTMYDMVFIDANHDFEWAYKDFTTYRNMAYWCAFHDISDFNIAKTTLKYGKDIANAAHLWKAITEVRLQIDDMGEKVWDEFIDYDNSIDMSKMDLKPRGIGVWKN